jgi:hypothetical protein
MVNVSQTMYDGNQIDHHLSEKYSASAFFNKHSATKFKAIVIASPTNPMNAKAPASQNDLHGFIFLSACADA